MDFQKLKMLAKQIGGILVMDGNEPQFVVLPYEKYDAGRPVETPTDHGEDQMIENLNKEIEALKEEIRLKETAELA